jgi:structural maintenance of chromosome 2
VLAGKSSANEKKCLEDQLRDARAEVGEAQSGLKSLTAKISHSEKELKEKKAHLVSKRDEATAAEKELKARTSDLESLKTSMGSINYKEGQLEVLQKVYKGQEHEQHWYFIEAHVSDLLHIPFSMSWYSQDRSTELKLIQELKDTVRRLSAEVSNVDFRYRDPVRGFDRSKVKGVVARLIRIKDSSAVLALEVCFRNFLSGLSFKIIFYLHWISWSSHPSSIVCQILQVAAEGRLYNVVVDTDATGKQLLQNGDLRKRVTIVPLNKIQTRTIPDRVQQTARRLVSFFFLFSFLDSHLAGELSKWEIYQLLCRLVLTM